MFLQEGFKYFALKDELKELQSWVENGRFRVMPQNHRTKELYQGRTKAGELKLVMGERQMGNSFTKHLSCKTLLGMAVAVLLTIGISLPAYAVEKTVNPSGVSYQMPDDSDYQTASGKVVTSYPYGKTHIGTLEVSGNIANETTFNGKTAYSVSDVVTFGYYYNGSYQNDDKDSWNIHDAGSKVKWIDYSKTVKTGMIIIEKSFDGTTWELATTPTNDFFKNHVGNTTLYTTDATDIMNGTYYRVSVVYKMKKRASQGNFAWVIPTEDYEYIECVEQYEFYVCSDQNYVTVQDLVTKAGLGNNASTSNGFYIQKNGSTDKVIVTKDGLAGKEAYNYDCFTQPGKYKVEITTGLGQKWYYTINITDGLSMTTMSPSVYESKKNSGFPMDAKVNGNTVIGNSSLTEVSIARSTGSAISTSTHNGYAAYGITGKNLSLFLRLKSDADNVGNGWSIVYDSWGKKEKEKINGIMTGEIGKGALIIQTSKDGNEWENVDQGRYAAGLYTTDYSTYYAGNQNVLIYTPSGEDILAGIYVRVLYAYQLKSSDGKETKDYLESYEFYLCSNELNAVTFHNLSVTEQLEQMLGDADETTVQMLKTAESMLSGACTTTGFSIDTTLNPTVTVSVKRNGSPVTIPASKKFTETGKYDIRITSAVGTTRNVVLYVDRNTDEEALSLYFGNGFILEDSKRIFAEGDYPTYEGGQVYYNIESVNGSFVPISGMITNTTTGKTISINRTTVRKTGTLTDAGSYVAEFTTNPNFESDDASGDARVFTFRFNVIAEGTAPGPVVNQNTLKDYAHLTMSDSCPVYYGLTYQSAGTGNITLVFSTREAAIQYAYEHEKGRVEKQKDGTYRYDGIYMTSQKICYESNWDLTDAIYYFAEQAVQTLYFDLSDEFYYMTLSSSVLKSNSNLKTLELKNSVVIFADGQKELLTELEGLPLINDKPYSYLDPKNGTVTRGLEGFRFVTDAYGGIDSSNIVITDANGTKYDIDYTSNVGSQLESSHCASGVVTITEATKYGDTATYQALYIAPDDNQTELVLTCYEGRTSTEISVNKANSLEELITDSFSIKRITDKLDPYALVVVQNGQREFPFVAGDTPEMIWSEPGKYTIRCVNRMGYGFSQEITVVESDNAVISFTGEGTDELQSILTYFGAKNVILPQLSRYGYEFIGFIDDDRQIYGDSIATIPYRGEKVLETVWKPKQVTVLLCDESGKQIGTVVGEFGKTYEIPAPDMASDKSFVGWQRNGVLLTTDSILLDTEENITLTMLTDEKIAESQSDVTTKTETSTPWALIVIGIAALSGFVFFKKVKKIKGDADE